MLVKKELKLKCQFFQGLGYKSVNERELLNYVTEYRWKKKPPKSIVACRQDILSITPNEFFDYQQLKAQTSQFKINDPKNLNDLF